MGHVLGRFSEIIAYQNEGRLTISSQDNYGDTPLHHLVLLNDNYDDIKHFLAVFPELDTTIQNNNGSTALHLAALINNISAITALIEVMTRSEDGTVSALALVDNEGNLPIHYAAIQANILALSIIISNSSISTGALVNRSGRNSLHFAAASLSLGFGGESTLRILCWNIEEPEHLWKKDELGRIHLHYMALQTPDDIEDHAIKSEMDNGTGPGLGNIHSIRGQPFNFRFHRQGIPSPELLSADIFGTSPLGYAFERNGSRGVDILEEFLDLATMPSEIGFSRVSNGQPFLHYAVSNLLDSDNATKRSATWRRANALLRSRFAADFSEQLDSSSGESILHILARYSIPRSYFPGIARSILSEASSSKIALNRQDNSGFTPVHLSILSHGHQKFRMSDCLDLIKCQSFDLSSQCGPLRETPIHIAARLWDLDKLERFLGFVETLMGRWMLRKALEIKNRLG